MRVLVFILFLSVINSQQSQARSIEWELVLSSADNIFELVSLLNKFGTSEISDEEGDEFTEIEKRLAPLKKQISSLRKLMVNTAITAKERKKEIEKLNKIINQMLADSKTLRLEDERTQLLIRKVRDLKNQIDLIENEIPGLATAALKDPPFDNEVVQLHRDALKWMPGPQYTFCNLSYNQHTYVSKRLRVTFTKLYENLVEAQSILNPRLRFEKLYSAVISAKECVYLVKLKCDSDVKFIKRNYLEERALKEVTKTREDFLAKLNSIIQRLEKLRADIKNGT